jgi:hypothetical protein
MLVGYSGFVGSAVLYSFAWSNNSYWAFVFTGAVLSVTGVSLSYRVFSLLTLAKADLIYNVANIFILTHTESSRQSLYVPRVGRDPA